MSLAARSTTSSSVGRGRTMSPGGGSAESTVDTTEVTDGREEGRSPGGRRAGLSSYAHPAKG